MCVLMVADGGFTPTKEQLEEGCRRNPDGFGYAVVCEGKIVVGKGMVADPVIEEFLTLRAMYPNNTALFHARIGTHGVKSEYNVHPFPVDEDGKIVLAHNGIIPVLSMRKKKEEIRSDTRIFAEDYLEKFGVEKLDDPQMFDMVEDYLGKGNKVAILNVSDVLKDEVYIFNYSQGYTTQEKHVWWSNKSFEKQEPYKYSGKRTGRNDIAAQNGCFWDYDKNAYFSEHEGGVECDHTGRPKVMEEGRVPNNKGVWVTVRGGGVGGAGALTTSFHEYGVGYPRPVTTPLTTPPTPLNSTKQPGTELVIASAQGVKTGQQSSTSSARTANGGGTSGKKDGEGGQGLTESEDESTEEWVQRMVAEARTGQRRGKAALYTWEYDCPYCDVELTGYSYLHEVCEGCATCLRCLKRIDECVCEEQWFRTQEEKWGLISDIAQGKAAEFKGRQEELIEVE